MWYLIFVCVAIVAAMLWLAGVRYFSDSSIPLQKLNGIRRVLVVFPHPDDETNVAGTLWQLHRLGVPTTIAVLTGGERGTPDAHLETSLKATRCAEMRHVGQLLGTQVDQEDFGDGHIAECRGRVRTYVAQLLDKVQPDVLITYDRAGMYGHEDHIACTECITELLHQDYPGVSLWYVSFPEHLLRASNLPTHMAKDPGFAARRSHANARVFIGRGIIPKIRSVYAHTSQRRSFRENGPRFVPIWLTYSLLMNEHFEIIRHK